MGVGSGQVFSLAGFSGYWGSRVFKCWCLSRVFFREAYPVLTHHGPSHRTKASIRLRPVPIPRARAVAANSQSRAMDDGVWSAPTGSFGCCYCVDGSAHARRQSMRMTDRPPGGELEPEGEGTRHLPM